MITYWDFDATGINRNRGEEVCGLSRKKNTKETNVSVRITLLYNPVQPILRPFRIPPPTPWLKKRSQSSLHDSIFPDRNSFTRGSFALNLTMPGQHRKCWTWIEFQIFDTWKHKARDQTGEQEKKRVREMWKLGWVASNRSSYFARRERAGKRFLSCRYKKH